LLSLLYIYCFPTRRSSDLIRHITTGYSTDFGNFKYFPYLNVASDYLFKSWLQHSFNGIFYLVDRIVNDGVMADFYLLLLGNFFGIGGGPYLEAKYNGI